MEEKLKKYLSKLNCWGCYNHCPLNSPACGRSKIYIQEATQKYNDRKNGDSFGTDSFLKKF